MLLRPLLPAALALAGLVTAAPLRAAPSLQALQEALNSSSPEVLTTVLEPGKGLDPDEVANRRLLLREQFPDASWTVQPGAPLKDGRATTQINVAGSREEGAYRFRFEAQQQLVLGASGDRFNSQEVIRESSILRSGDSDLKVSLLIPDAVLTGQRYDVDVVFDEPLDGAVVAGALQPVSAADLLRMRTPDLQLEALGGGGIFKSAQAPYQPGTQTWAVLLVHPKGIVAASKQVKVVADRAALSF
ncbi:hypothetical protein [Synechococcus sp. LA31]|uniref:hypothetical protein n=1 Tax=Synechococcus sp. LA31 TaxID=2741953 RepID=UPI001BDD82AD|nr:hypothetical protein [Synechococcus sp. LA31]QVV67313.1 hypothetical protein KJJ24_12915 [Synechococcus sp. LA31]